MTRLELELIFSQLAKEGWEPRLCSEFRYEEIKETTDPMMCSEPYEQYMMLPPEMLSMHPTGAVTAIDNSMIDAGIKKGDTLIVLYSDYFEDGDVVLAYINGKMNVRCYCKDYEGNVWLVPQNNEFDAVMVKDSDIKIYAHVQKYIRAVSRLPYSSCRKSIDKALNKQQLPKKITDEQVSWVIQQIGPTITIARRWFAVFRPLVQTNYYTAKQYEAFTLRVRKELPNHPNLPVAEEMQKMDTQSFTKEVKRWVEDNAPVSGKRFDNYKEIAERTLALLDADFENSL